MDEESVVKAVKRIENQREGYRELAKQALSWVIHAKRPLSVIELRSVLTARKLDEALLPELDFLSSISAGLVTVDKSHIIRLVLHPTWKLSELIQSSLFPHAPRDTATTCITYLLAETFESGFCSTDGELEERLRLNPLYDYASRNWGHHARAVSTEVEPLILDLLENETKISACSQAMTASKLHPGDSGYSQRVPQQVTGVHLAAFFGLKEAMMKLLEDGYEADVKDTYGKTPLSWAAEGGHETVVRVLLERKDVDPEPRDNYGRTPLIWAARSGHAEVVKLFLKQGATFSAREAFSVAAQRVAVESGHHKVIELRRDGYGLLDPGTLEAPEIVAFLQGKWSGNYYYRYRSGSENNPVSFTLSVNWDPVAAENLSVVGDGQDFYGQFTMQGVMRRNGEISFAKMYPQYGWIYSGQLDTESGTMFGWWGSNDQDIHGTFAFCKDLKNTTSLSRAASVPPGTQNESARGGADLDQTALQAPAASQSMAEAVDHALCTECSGINFTEMGFQDQHSKTRFGARRDLSLARLREMAESCAFCRHILTTFNLRLRRCAGEEAQHNLNMDKSSIAIYNNDFFNNPAKTWLSYLSAHVSAAIDRSHTSYQVVKFHFQKGSSKSMTVGEVCDGLSNLEWPQVEHGIARWRPLVADCRLFRKWYQFCDRFHEHQSCIPLAHQADLRFIRLIDVQLKCLVTKSPDKQNGDWNISWVALSYVWGSTNDRRLTHDTQDEFQEEGIFGTGSFPKTILDAIQVTESLGERYLWVDVCCIIQDDDLDKRDFMPQMDTIYGLASLTIVNAAGNHADHGLPGVRPATRHNVQRPFHVQGVSVVETLDPGEFGTRGIDSYLEGTTWGTRGWTLQEGLLSRRLLIFTPEQVYWECSEATWCEDSHWETSVEPSKNRVFDHIQLEHIETSDFWIPEIKTFDKNYRHLVLRYSMRQLTDEGDFLNAFLGILNSLEIASGTKFFWGIPITFLAGGMAWWRPSYLNDRGKVRPGKCKIQFGRRLCEVSYPSWSWVSCVGGHVFYLDYDYLNGPDAGIVFHVINQDGKVEELARNTEFRTDHALKADVSDATWKEARKTTVATGDVPQSLLESDIAPTLLLFYTSSAELDATTLPDDKPALTYNGRNVEVRWGQEPDFVSLGSRLLFIIIGLDNRKSWEEKELYLRALVVKEGDYGVLYRIGMISILEKEWDSIMEKRWKLVFLA